MKTQQYNLYAAEDAVTSRGKEFDSLASIQDYLIALRDSEWFDRLYPTVHGIEVGDVKLRNKDGSVGGMSGNFAYIEMAPCHWVENFVLHEIAHPLSVARFGSTGHDPWFTKVYLELVYYMRGEQAWRELRGSFVAHGIEFLHVATKGAVPLDAKVGLR